MKICVVGAGGLGGLFGGFLAHAGEDISFIARGAHLSAMRQNGLRVETPLGDRTVHDVVATDDPAAVGAVDVVLICVKNYDLAATAGQCRPLVGPETAVISVLNGVDAPGVLAAAFGEAQVTAGLTYVPSNIAAPGVISHKNSDCSLSFGPLPGEPGRSLRQFRDACERAGVGASILEDIQAALWRKFMAWSASAAMTALSRQPIGVIQRVPELKSVFRDVTREAHAVARHEGIDLPEDVLDRILETFEAFAPEAKSSTLVDLENGKPLELEAGVGSIVRLANAAGINVPVSRTAYAALLPFRDGAPADR